MNLFDEIANFVQRSYIGVVAAVDTEAYTLIATLDGGRVISNVPWVSPQGHPDGTGSHAMYRVGTRIYVTEYEYGEFIVMGSIPALADGTGACTNSRKVLNQGDNYLSVSDQTFILLQRPEFITISGNYACQMKFDGTNNVIYLRSQRYQVQADGGSIGWESDPNTKDTVLNMVMRDGAAKDSNTVQIRAGFHKTEDEEAREAGIDKSVFSIIVSKVEQTSSDEYEATPQFKLIVGENGRILQSANSIKETYKEYIDRYAGTTMADTAEKSIETTSLTDGIYESALTEIINIAKYINHKD